MGAGAGALQALVLRKAAREVGDWELAAWAGRQLMEHDPNYAGSHEALALVAEHRGDANTAHAERALAEKYWKNADPEVKKQAASLRK